MVKDSKLEARLPKTCYLCSKDFLAKQANTKLCEECRYRLFIKPIPCKCGCGKTVRGESKKGYAPGCKARGKSYLEIYGKKGTKSGFKKGLENANFTSKEFQKYKLFSPDKNGRLFRSSLEANFSNLLLSNGIRYNYEVRVPLINGRLKVVDFVIPSLDKNIYVEITGYSYSKWQSDFDSKFKVLKKSLGDQPILVLTYKDKLELVRDRNIDRDIFFDAVDNEEGILKKICLFRSMLFVNNNILKWSN